MASLRFFSQTPRAVVPSDLSSFSLATQRIQPKAHKTIDSLQGRFALKLTGCKAYQKAMSLLADASVTMCEAILIQTLEEDFSLEAKRLRIQNELEKLPKRGAAYGCDLKKKLHPVIVRDAVSKLASPT